MGAKSSTVGQPACRTDERPLAEPTAAADLGAGADEGERADLGARTERHAVHREGPLTEHDAVTNVGQTGDERETRHANAGPKPGTGPDDARAGVHVVGADIHIRSRHADRGRGTDQTTAGAHVRSGKDAHAGGRRHHGT